MATNVQINLFNQTATVKGAKQMDTSELIRWTGVSAMVAGIYFRGHSADPSR